MLSSRGEVGQTCALTGLSSERRQSRHMAMLQSGHVILSPLAYSLGFKNSETPCFLMQEGLLQYTRSARGVLYSSSLNSRRSRRLASLGSVVAARWCRRSSLETGGQLLSAHRRGWQLSSASTARTPWRRHSMQMWWRPQVQTMSVASLPTSSSSQTKQARTSDVAIASSTQQISSCDGSGMNVVVVVISSRRWKKVTKGKVNL